MAKKPQHRALFELLAREREERDEKGEAPARPEPVVRRPQKPSAARGDEKPARAGVPLQTPIAYGGVWISYYWLAVVIVAVLCLCAIFYFLGARLSGGGGETGEKLPSPPREPAFEAVRKGAVTPGLAEIPGAGEEREIGPDASENATAGEEEAVAETPDGAEEMPPETPAERYRVRLMRLSVAKEEYTNRLLAFLQQRGIDLEIVSRGGYYILYTKRRFATEAETNDYARTMNELLREFGRETGWYTSADAYTVLVE